MLRKFFGAFVIVLFLISCASSGKSQNMDKLENELDRNMRERAIELSKARHRNSDLKDILLISNEISKDGGFINITKTYEVSMIGNILGIIGNTDRVTVTGQIDTRNNTTRILEAYFR
jgi:hypothetical protein